MSIPDVFVYYGYEDFVLKHGKFYESVPRPRGLRLGMPKACFANSIFLGARRNWKYVEGYATPILDNGASIFPVHHGWNLDDKGRLVDSTWKRIGSAYFGVEFSIERAFDAAWNGDAAILDDWKRKHPLLCRPWNGETPENAVPTCPQVELLRAGKLRRLYRSPEVCESQTLRA